MTPIHDLMRLAHERHVPLEDLLHGLRDMRAMGSDAERAGLGLDANPFNRAFAPASAAIWQLGWNDSRSANS